MSIQLQPYTYRPRVHIHPAKPHASRVSVPHVDHTADTLNLPSPDSFSLLIREACKAVDAILKRGR